MTRPGHIGSGPVWQRSRYGQKPTGSLAVAGSRGGRRAQHTYAFGVWNVIKNKYLL